MGAGASLSHLPEAMTKSECMILIGSSFSEEMWKTHAVNGKIARDVLLQLYAAGTDKITHQMDITSLQEGRSDLSESTEIMSNPSTSRTSFSGSNKQSSPSNVHCNDSLSENISSIPLIDETIVHITSSDGSSSYVGTCYEGKPHGKGKFTFKSGAFYDGEFCLGKKNGQGLYKYSSGAIYCGEWKNDMRDGQGVYRLPSGDEYRGGWKENLKSGQGRYTYVSVDGGVYTGQWKHDKKHGFGTYDYSNGDVYAGYWVVGKKSGSGKYTYSSGEVYEGDWNANLMHGYGKYSDASGKISYEGEYKYGSIFNFASITDPSISTST